MNKVAILRGKKNFVHVCEKVLFNMKCGAGRERTIEGFKPGYLGNLNGDISTK
jgi:hypothetical protein